SRSARAAAERAREHGAPQTRSGRRRHSAPFRQIERRVRRSGPVVAAQGRLGQPLDRHGAASPLTRPLSAAARTYVTGVILAGAVVFATCLPLVQLDSPMLLIVLVILSSATAVLKVHLPLL